MKITEFKNINGKMQLVTRDMTAEEQEKIEALREDETKRETDALTEMITEMSKATTLAQMRNAAKGFLNKTE